MLRNEFRRAVKNLLFLISLLFRGHLPERFGFIYGHLVKLKSSKILTLIFFRGVHNICAPHGVADEAEEA